MAYVTFDFYTEDFYGDAVTISDFDKLAEKASTIIDYLCFDRVAAVILANTDTSLVTKIKKATCAVMDVMQDIAANDTGITSEAVASYKVTYSMGSARLASKDVRYMRAAKLYLGSSGLMYKGTENTGYYED